MPDLTFAGADISAPARRAQTWAPSDSTPTPFVTRGIYVGAGGNIRVITANGDDVTFTAVPVGVILPVRVTQIMATSTTAASLVILQ